MCGLLIYDVRPRLTSASQRPAHLSRAVRRDVDVRLRIYESMDAQNVNKIIRD